MKTLAFLIILFFLSFPSLAQKTLIVDNTGSAPAGDHVYTDLQTAIDAAEEGDIIHVMPSPTIYEELVFDGISNLSIIGIGINPNLISNENTFSSATGPITILEASNLTLSGLTINNITIGDSEQDLNIPNEILIENSSIVDVQIYDISNSKISNSFLGAMQISGQISSLIISNSIIKGRQGDLNNTMFVNNILTNTESFWSNTQVIRNCIFENNIFWDVTALFNFGRNNSSNSIYRNNYSTFVLPGYTSNISENNITSITGDLFIDEQVDDSFFGGWQSYWDTAISTSELQNTGTDGTDIGPSGGAIPYKVNASPLPVINEIIAPTTFKVGTSPEVTIKAKGN